jgi:Tol biopolymer transport system component
MGSTCTFIGRRTILGSAVAVCLAIPSGSQAAGPGLVFSVRTWDGEYASRDVPGGVESTPTVGSIYTVNADGTGLKRVVPPSPGVDFPAASPDGKWVYYQAGARGGIQVYRCRRDGTGTTSLTPPDQLSERLKGGTPFRVKEAFGYALSADGTRMVFTADDGTTGRAVIADADGSSPALVAPGLGYTYMARFGPTNDRVVFSGPARGYRLLLAALPDGKPVELTPDHPECFVPQFTPDGRAVVFVRRDGDVYCVGADGKDLRRLTEGNKYVEFRLSPKDTHGSTDGPDVSPDGKRIAFIALKDGVSNVFVISIDGRDHRQVTARKAPCGRVTWSPDGIQLSFVSFEGKYPQLFVVPADGGEPRQITKLDGGVNFARWLPE